MTKGLKTSLIIVAAVGLVLTGAGCGGGDAKSPSGQKATMAKEPLANLEYVKLCDPESLMDVETIDRSALLALAVRFGRARLIDNRVLTR